MVILLKCHIVAVDHSEDQWVAVVYIICIVDHHQDHQYCSYMSCDTCFSKLRCSWEINYIIMSFVDVSSYCLVLAGRTRMYFNFSFGLHK